LAAAGLEFLIPVTLFATVNEVADSKLRSSGLPGGLGMKLR